MTINKLENPKLSPVIVNGKEYGFQWQDFGSFSRINVYQNGKRIGFKDYPIRVDTGMGTIKYSVKSILEGGRNGLKKRPIAKA